MENRFLLLIRYIVITIVVGTMVLFPQGILSSNHIVLALLLIINSQLRYFVFRERTLFLCFSLVAECTLGAKIILDYNILLLPIFTLTIYDGLLFMKTKLKYLCASIFLATFLFLGMGLPWEVKTIVYISMFINVLVLSHILELKNRQYELDKLYQESRRVEDELLKTNEDLEIYAESIKELTVLQERNRISREIHDSVGHSLSTIIVQLGAIEQIAGRDGQKAAIMAAKLRCFAKSGLEEIRTALRELKPRDLDNLRTLLLIEALTTNFSKLTGIEVYFKFSQGKWELEESISLVIYRAIQEFLSNSARHGQPKKIKIFLHFDSEVVILTMEDDGFGVEEIEPGMGLRGLADRVHELGGKISYKSGPRKGFFLRISLERGFVSMGQREGSEWKKSV